MSKIEKDYNFNEKTSSLTEFKDSDNSSMRDPNVSMNEVGISVSTMSFLATVVFFLIGLLMNNKSADADLFVKLRLPMLFLFISSFGFMFSTLIYGNASGDIARLNEKNFSRQMTIANIISEYLGVYMLCYAMPILVLGYLPDKLLSIFVLVVEVLGFSAYHIFGYSILERYFSKTKTIFIMASGVALQLASFLSFYFVYDNLYYIFTFILIFHVLFITVFSIIKGDEINVVGKRKPSKYKK
jgi:hypothetical protein